MNRGKEGCVSKRMNGGEFHDVLRRLKNTGAFTQRNHTLQDTRSSKPKGTVFGGEEGVLLRGTEKRKSHYHFFREGIRTIGRGEEISTHWFLGGNRLTGKWI